MTRARSQRRDHELLGKALMGFVINTMADCTDDDEAKIMWLIDGMEDYAAADHRLADIRGRIKRLLIDEWIRFDHQPPPTPARPQIEAEPDDDIPF
jgi:hypothetical protein